MVWTSKTSLYPLYPHHGIYPTKEGYRAGLCAGRALLFVQPGTEAQ